MQLLRDAGIEEPVRELAAFVRSPEAHAANVRARLVTRSLAAGEEHLLHKRTSAALTAFGRALALDPQNAQANGRVDRIRRRDRLQKLARGVVIALVAIAVLVAAGWELYRASQREAARAARDRVAQVQADADRRAREKAEADAAARAAKAAKPQPPAVVDPGPGQPVAVEPPRKRPAPPARSPDAFDVKLHARYGADVTVDGRELGYETMFSLKLPPGPHRVLVRHACCAPANQLVAVTRNQPGQMYKLRYGLPNPARFEVVNAPPDARVLVDGVLVGTASDPRPYAMTEPAQRATITIGDRTLIETLKAGSLNRLDYSKASP